METIIEWLQGQMPTIINDLWAIQLSIIGIAVSVMALLFASHIGKVEAQRHISRSKDINKELLSIYFSNGIKTFEKLNGKIIVVFIGACTLFVCSSVVKYVCCMAVLFWIGLADLLLTMGLVVWTYCVVNGVVSLYKEEVK